MSDTILQFLAAGILALFTFFVGRGKQSAEITSLITDASISLLKPLEEKVQELNEKVKILEASDKKKQQTITQTINKLNYVRKRYRELLDGVEILVAQLIDVGMKPKWIPKPSKDVLNNGN